MIQGGRQANLRISGLDFVYDGTTDEAAPRIGTRPAYQSHRYGERWAPVLVTWDRPARVARLRGRTLAFGGSNWVRTRTGPVFVSGVVVVDAGFSGRAGFAPGRSHGTIVLHELGHLVGLSHSDTPGEVMHRRFGSRSRAGWSPRERAVLATLSLAPCLPHPTPG